MTAPDYTALCAQGEAAMEGTTDAPWAIEYRNGTTCLMMGDSCQMCDETYYPWTPDNDKDWHFIAWARNNVPALIAAIRELQARVRESAMQELASLGQAQEAYEAQLAAEAKLAEVERERDEARRRRDAWKAKAEGYDELAAAVRAKIKAEPATMSRVLLKGALIEADRRAAAAEAKLAEVEKERDELRREGNPADHALVDRYRNTTTGKFVFPDDVAAIIRRLDAAEATVATLTAQVEAMRGALTFYRNGFERKTKRSKTGLVLSVEYVPTETLLNDCGNRATDALDAALTTENQTNG